MTKTSSILYYLQRSNNNSVHSCVSVEELKCLSCRLRRPLLFITLLLLTDPKIVFLELLVRFWQYRWNDVRSKNPPATIWWVNKSSSMNTCPWVQRPTTSDTGHICRETLWSCRHQPLCSLRPRKMPSRPWIHLRLSSLATRHSLNNNNNGGIYYI